MLYWDINFEVWPSFLATPRYIGGGKSVAGVRGQLLGLPPPSDQYVDG
jgi:hypothetical protein